MPVSTSLSSYADCRSALDRALHSENGVTVTFDTKGKAHYFMMRCYKLRALDRQASTRIYTHDDPRHNVSVYDVLTLEKVENILYIKQSSPDALNIQEIQG